MDSSHELDLPTDQPQYPGEDTRLTSTKELSGWYSYGVRFFGLFPAASTLFLKS